MVSEHAMPMAYAIEMSEPQALKLLQANHQISQQEAQELMPLLLNEEPIPEHLVNLYEQILLLQMAPLTDSLH